MNRSSVRFRQAAPRLTCAFWQLGRRNWWPIHLLVSVVGPVHRSDWVGRLSDGGQSSSRRSSLPAGVRGSRSTVTIHRAACTARPARPATRPAPPRRSAGQGRRRPPAPGRAARRGSPRRRRPRRPDARSAPLRARPARPGSRATQAHPAGRQRPPRWAGALGLAARRPGL
jgi:hypothetical protein